MTAMLFSRVLSEIMRPIDGPSLSPYFSTGDILT